MGVVVRVGAVGFGGFPAEGVVVCDENVLGFLVLGFAFFGFGGGRVGVEVVFSEVGGEGGHDDGGGGCCRRLLLLFGIGDVFLVGLGMMVKA